MLLTDCTKPCYPTELESFVRAELKGATTSLKDIACHFSDGERVDTRSATRTARGDWAAQARKDRLLDRWYNSRAVQCALLRDASSHDTSFPAPPSLVSVPDDVSEGGTDVGGGAATAADDLGVNGMAMLGSAAEGAELVEGFEFLAASG